MVKIIVDAALRKQLAALDQPAELCDEAGSAVGQFIPNKPWEPTLTKDEIDRCLQGPEYTTSEALKRLETQ